MLRFLVSFRRIWRYGRFEHRGYANRYLEKENYFLFALAHFLLRGEAAGNRPNAFFDPRFFRSQVGRPSSYSEYLDNKELWIFSTSREFDAGWYCDKYAELVPTCKPPLLHYLETGFDKMYEASPYFDTAFFHRAVARDEYDARIAAFRLISRSAGPCLYNARDLSDKQQRFRDRIILHERQKPAKVERRNLVFVQAGKLYSRRFSRRRSFDVLINLYEARFFPLEDVDYVVHQVGTKCTAIFKLLSERPGLLTSYDAVLLLDDDVEISEMQIEQLFVERERGGFDLMQASLSERSACFFPYLKQPLAGPGTRAMTAVEIMMPVVARRVFEEFASAFAMSVSGWGLDLLLSKLVRERFGDTIAMAGDIVCEHLRPVDREGGYYRMLSQAGIMPSVEAGHLASTYGLNDKSSGIRPIAAEVLLQDACAT